jgi:hypothetical protein
MPVHEFVGLGKSSSAVDNRSRRPYNARVGVRRLLLAALMILAAAAPTLAQRPRRTPPAARQRATVEVDAGSVHNAGKLLRETPLVRIHLGKSIGRRAYCTPTLADVVVVFKVDDRYRITDDENYWRLVEDEVVPAVTAECGGVRRIGIENYVEGYRLASLAGAQPRVYRLDEPFPTIREQQPGIARADGEAYESPVSTATRTLGLGEGRGRSFERNHRDPTQPLPASIAEARTEFERYGEVVATIAADRRQREEQERADRVEMLRWSYRHGSGFVISDRMRRRQSEAAALLGDLNPYTLIVKTGEAMRAGKRLDATLPLDATTALAALAAQARMSYVERVLATLPRWTAARLQEGDALTEHLSSDAFARDIFIGRFSGWLGEEPAGPITPVLQPARGMDLDLGFVAYHRAYHKACGSDRAVDWTPVEHKTDRVTSGPFGREIGRQNLSTISYNIRKLYADQYIAASDYLDVSIRGRRRTDDVDRDRLESSVATWLTSAGCATDAVRQFEVNLLLATQGYPPLQRLLEIPAQSR